MRLAVVGDIINYPGNSRTPTANMLLVKMLAKTVISTMGAKFMTRNINNFYFDTPLERYEYVHLKLKYIP